jgi:hypothetical protein
LNAAWIVRSEANRDPAALSTLVLDLCRQRAGSQQDTDMATQQILRSRRGAARQPLQDQRHLPVPDRRKDLDDIDAQIDKMRQLLRAATTKVSDAERNRYVAPRKDTALAAAKIDVSKLRGRERAARLPGELKALEQIVGRMRPKCFRIQDEPVGSEITKDLGKRTKPPLDH